ncbi:MAG: sulfite exporter TauE/SafE family protein [Bacteroidia bacterium]|nr:sulfite exporter TauE/SafE family protein [Bacteroidia bacterium]NND26736.1 sulfite exporter TauE/SafE family protein [Flavobacteriaceae bacterium]MBT8278140.1 sulfite exporter TauE/SafE family protein [Bacteroidia bacterium]NNK61338.1 sulfite exporter TauE/SafE family protein [Flavobacteriaceae bacterium]NNL32436.1 sulfite exporter TauE/SafE family protein [Flavobacteriaceae bacterium]
MKNLEYIFLILALIAEVVGTVGGFGSSVFFVPVANFYFDFQTVLGITALFHVASNLSKIAMFKKGIDRKLILSIGVPAVIFVIIGGFVSKYLKSYLLEIFLGIFLIGLSLLFLVKTNLIIKPERREAILGGTLSGFFAGILGTGGAIRGLTMAAFNLEKSAFIATSAVIDFCVDLSRSVVYFFNGFITSEILIYIPFLVIISIIGTFIGKRLLLFISQENFKKFSLILILLIGVVTLVSALQ